MEETSMKRLITVLYSLLITLIFSFILVFSGNVLVVSASSVVPQVTPVGPELPEATEAPIEGAVHGYYFYANSCSHCITILDTILFPLEEEYGPLLDIRLLETSIPAYYEALLTIEDDYAVGSSERQLPTLVIGDAVLIGETAVKAELPEIVERGLETGGIPFPEIPGVDPESLISVDPEPVDEETCAVDSGDGCVVDAPIFIAYFYQTGCDECSRVNADLAYLQTRYPQMQVVEFNVYDNADLALWMVEQVGYSEDLETPALFIGDHVITGDEILPKNIEAILQEVADTGTEPIWLSYDSDQGQRSIIDNFKNMGWLAVVAAGLIDGINPCAFATLIFFVSYLTLSGRSGKEVLFVGGAFTFGVFLAYLAVGLGLYQILELVGETLDLIASIVYALTGVFCLVLAVLSFLDYRKARQGDIGDMLLKLPEPLRKRINTTIRKGRKARSYVLGAFFAGVMISFLELACTGQVYLPTIIFVSSIPELRLRAIAFLVIYNLLFVLPLVVIFVLVYFGTTSKDLTRFLREKAALVKLGMTVVFIALGGWLLISLFI
jgi:cytochrome c biogenesis protein CcdA